VRRFAYDDTREAVIEPRAYGALKPVPRRVVLCYFAEVVTRWRDAGVIEPVVVLTSAMGDHPVYRWTSNGVELALCHPGVGAPLSAMILEELIAHGGAAFVACGGAGVLRKDIAAGHLVIPTAAVRDEGTSYHYLPGHDDARPSPMAVQAIEQTLRDAGISFLRGTTWTTDAVYRETRQLVAHRAAEGCLTVEMEAAALFAVAEFRHVALGQILYGGDDVSGLAWDRRERFDRSLLREALIRIAGTACAAIALPEE
jgi:uridine phosphorylase